MDEIVWEDPPLSHAGPTGPRWADRLAPLRERPGEWANLGRHNPNYVTQINQGSLTGIEPGEFEAVGRRSSGDGKRDLYVRYIGKPAKVRSVS